jgi:predicted RNA binding protein YcfA (HicA-like mRNA interferase family)
MTGRELIRLLEANGWTLARVQGSHHIFVKREETLVVPVHGKKDLHKGTVEAIRKKGGLK